MHVVGSVRAGLAAIPTRRLVLFCAVLTVLLHFPGFLWPLNPDEAGYTLVARAWTPEPDSLYGLYWVDRPPLLIFVFKAADAIGGPYFLRLVAAFGCAALVLISARCAQILSGDRGARWVAIVATVLTTNAMIDPVAAKGEILGIPVVVTSIWLALEALRVLERSRPRALLLAFGAGLAGATTLGLKQNMVTGLVFGGVVLIVSVLRRDITRSDFARLSASALLGAAVPIAATVGWCLAVGTVLHVLWYTVYGFRSDALAVISSQALGNSKGRAAILTLYFVLTGMAFFLGWLLLRVKSVWQRHPAVTAATVAIIVVDGTSLGLSGSFWRPYLHLLTPGVLLAVALLAGTSGVTLVWTRRFTGVAVLAACIALPAWTIQNLFAVTSPTAVETGEAIGAASLPGDSIVVHGGRADIVMASGLDTPYPYMWSLPMRTLDPDRAQMVELLRGDHRPTWFVEWVPLDAWSTDGLQDFDAALELFYEPHGVGCRDVPVYLRRGVERPLLNLDCESSWQFWNRR